MTYGRIGSAYQNNVKQFDSAERVAGDEQAGGRETAQGVRRGLSRGLRTGSSAPAGRRCAAVAWSGRPTAPSGIG
ncbi:hypothetical protein LP419_06350 [Massilia sp. H-1]|nr:hypothetical protein LP419_06350 [Massilia sp. H-1]